MPTRNRIRLLHKAVASALAQTYQNIELIVVDDSSIDGTRDFLLSKAQDDSRLIYFRNSKPLGAPASRNIAILNSKGTFVTGLDDDDEFLPERVGAFVDYWQLLTSRGVRPALLYSQDQYRENGALSFVTNKRSNIIADDIFEANHIGNQIFAPKVHYIEAGLFDEKMPAWQDLELFIRILSRFGSGHLLDMPTYLFDNSQRADRISVQLPKVRAAMEIVMKKHAADSPQKSRLLFMQLFADCYGIRPKMSDWFRLFSWGIRPIGIRRLWRAALRRQKISPKFLSRA